MTIRHLEIFAAVMDCGKMSRAAEKLYITQPSVSQAIRGLEDYYRVRLFERLSKQPYPMDEGRTLLFYVCYIADSFEGMEPTMKNRDSIGRLRIDASMSVGTCLLGEELNCLEVKLSGIKTKTTVCNTSVIKEVVLKSEPDIGLVEGFVDSGNIVCIPFYEDKLVIVVSRSHPLYEQKNPTLFCLNRQNYISRETGSVEKNRLEQMPDVKEMNLKQIWSRANTEAIKGVVMEGRGFAILSRMIARKGAVEGPPQTISEESSMKRDTQLIYHRDKYLSEGLKTFLDIRQNQNAR